MSRVTFSDWEGLRAHGIRSLDLRNSYRGGMQMRVVTVMGDVWVPIDAESLATAAGIADVYWRTMQAAVDRQEQFETDRVIARLIAKGYTVTPPEDE